jgi:hypothetical protein
MSQPYPSSQIPATVRLNECISLSCTTLGKPRARGKFPPNNDDHDSGAFVTKRLFLSNNHICFPLFTVFKFIRFLITFSSFFHSTD